MKENGDQSKPGKLKRDLKEVECYNWGTILLTVLVMPCSAGGNNVSPLQRSPSTPKSRELELLRGITWRIFFSTLLVWLWVVCTLEPHVQISCTSHNESVEISFLHIWLLGVLLHTCRRDGPRPHMSQAFLL